MTDWTNGYVADIDYTYGYFGELNPLSARLAFLSSGLVPPDNGIHCELGFGQGMSTNIHAAASVSTWYATDFNPAQAGFAQSVARASGADAHLYDQAFAEFCTRSDLPDFDSIELHGIWSWISEENRAVIVDFISRKLKVGGVLYVSYNTQPGWAAFAPMRHLLAEHAAVMGAKGVGTARRVDGALDFAEKLLATNPIYAQANPLVVGRLKDVRGDDRHYLAHEYFSRDWQPMHFATTANLLSTAKLDYACSAHYLDHIDDVNLTPDQQTLLKEIPDATFRQTVRDFMVNKQFRKDYWVKGARRLNPTEQSEALRAQSVVLVTLRSDASLKIAGAMGEVTMQESIYGPILDALADHKPQTLAQVERSVKEQGVSWPQIVQAVMVLVGAGYLVAVQDEALIPKARKLTDKLNAHLIDRTRAGSDIGLLASPVTGGGVSVGRFGQLVLSAINDGQQRPTEWAQSIWALMAARGQKLIKEGKVLDSAEENLAELTAQAQAYADKQLPILKALQLF